MKQLYTLLTFIAAFGFAGSAFAQVKGTVYRDFDLNGVRSDTLPVEVGVAGVMVLAFVDLNATPIQTVSDALGHYSFSATDIPAGKPVRIEFNSLPSGDYNGPYGGGSGTTVQFVKAPADGVNLGINYPSDYCQRTGVRLVMPCYINGNTQTTTDENGNPVPIDKQAGQGDALVGIAYEANGVAGASNFPPDHFANGKEVGAIWAMAYQRRTKKVFTAAVVKRHTTFGPLGTGGIYITDINTKTTTNFLDVKTLGIDTGDDFHSGLFADKTHPSTDPASMTAMGRVSFGGMDMSEDDKTLYFINLKDRKLYSLFINSPAVVPTSPSAVQSWAIPDPGCSNGDFRPWALKVYHGKIYVGVICSAETSQKQSDLKATIYRFDPKSATPVFEEVLSFPLDFRRGPADLTGTCVQYDHWLPWTEAWPTPCGEGNTPNFVMYPQPILSDIEFEDDGSMIIGFLDRFGHLVGVTNLDPQGKGYYDGFTGGDILRAYNNNGTLELEKNGRSGNRTGSGVGNNEGPVDANNVGGEFFGQDNWIFYNRVAHAEVTNGALSLIPGYKEVITSAFDPITDIYQSGGVKVFNTQTGAVNRNFVLYTLDGAPGSFGKASGLGDSKPLCDPASVEIGNRVWFDDNRNGIQDAYEPGIDGIVLTLHDMENGGALLATQTTHDGGQFYFNDSTVPGRLQYNHTYEIRMDTLQLPRFDITLAGTKILAPAGGRLAARSAGARQGLAGPQRYYFLSPANSTGFIDPTIRDSNAKLVGGSAVISLTTLDAGQNDFTYDLSIYSCPSLRTEKDTISLCAGIKLDSIAAVGDHFSRVDSVRFVLFSTPQSGTAMYGSGGVVLGTVKPDTITNRAVFYNPSFTTSNNSGSASNQYVYAIIYPTPENIACRQSGATVIKVSPALSVTASGGTLTCSLTAVSLQGQALYNDGTPAPGMTYSWSGPDGFSSTLASPVVSQAGSYSLTVSDPACPASLTTTTTLVNSDTVVPPLSASVIAKDCPSCSATLTASSPGNSLAWDGPNGYTATGSSQSVTADGLYSVTATASNGCRTSTQLTVAPSYCPVLTSERPSVSLCAGSSLDSIAVSGQQLTAGESVRFVLFSSPQSGTAMYANTGVELGTVSYDAVRQRAVLRQPVLNTLNQGSDVLKWYVYGLISPTPVAVECRTSAEVVVSVSPALSVTASGGTLTCSLTAVSLQGQALYGDGTPAPGMTYSWSGPDGFSSALASPVVSQAGSYSLTVSDPACPASLTTTTTLVNSDTVVPPLSASVIAKDCPSCAATLTASSPGNSLAWDGPNGYTATGSSQSVTADGLYSVTATASNGCRTSTQLTVAPSYCPVLTSERPSVSLCAGSSLDSIAVSGQQLTAGESVRFVLFSSPQSGTAMYANTGVELGTVSYDAVRQRAVLRQPVLNTLNQGSSVLKWYVYGLISPTPVAVECRTSAEVVVSVSPALSVTASGGTLTCSLTAVSLQGQALYNDGTPAPGMTYSWSGPNGFSSALASPVVSQAGSYSLTVSDPACPASLPTALAVVTADTVKPALTAFGAALPCFGCSATLFAEATGALLRWTGPNGFTSTLAEPSVTVPGDYTVIAKGVNGCELAETVELLPISSVPCSEPVCLPLTIKRIR